LVTCKVCGKSHLVKHQHAARFLSRQAIRNVDSPSSWFLAQRPALGRVGLKHVRN